MCCAQGFTTQPSGKPLNYGIIRKAGPDVSKEIICNLVIGEVYLAIAGDNHTMPV